MDHTKQLIDISKKGPSLKLIMCTFGIEHLSFMATQIISSICSSNLSILTFSKYKAATYATKLVSLICWALRRALKAIESNPYDCLNKTAHRATWRILAYLEAQWGYGVA